MDQVYKDVDILDTFGDRRSAITGRTEEGLVSDQSARTPGQDDLLTLNRAATVARLLAGVAHEVNNALQVIGGTTELLQVTPGLPGSVADGLRRIAVHNARAATVIQEVMVFARQKVGGASRTNLREIANRSVALRSFAIGRARLSIKVTVPPAGRFLVYGNDALLQLAVLNLIINAEQALAGRQGGAISLELTEPPGHVVLRVSDNGPGVDGAAAEELFESFFTTRVREEASGLGLSVARLVVEQCGGTLTLQAQDAGACFEMRLPSAL
jgi:two-component system C4-dicarboxylate transport sensor histidine kinase DctB